MEPFINNAIAQANAMSIHFSPLQFWCGFVSLIASTVVVTMLACLLTERRIVRDLMRQMDELDHSEHFNVPVKEVKP